MWKFIEKKMCQMPKSCLLCTNCRSAVKSVITNDERRAKLPNILLYYVHSGEGRVWTAAHGSTYINWKTAGFLCLRPRPIDPR